MKKLTFLTVILAIILSGCSKFETVDTNETSTNQITSTTTQSKDTLRMSDLSISENFDWRLTKTVEVNIILPEDDASRLLYIYSQDGKQLYFKGHPEDVSNILKTKITIPTYESVLMIKYGEGDTYPFMGSDVDGLNLNLKMSSALKTGSTNECDGNEDPNITSFGGYEFEFESMVENTNGTSTWTYTVTGIAGEDPNAHNLSHWVLALCDDQTVSTSTYNGQVVLDPVLEVYGIKWDKEISKSGGTATFTFTLNGLYDVVPVNVVAFKANGDLFYCTIPGPSCDGTTPDPDPEPQLDGTLAFEDLWPGKGDFDLNDLVLEYGFEVTKDNNENVEHLTATFIIKAFGAEYKNGFGFELPGVLPSDIVSVTGYDVESTWAYDIASNGVENGQSNAVFIVYDNAFRIMEHPGMGIGVNTVEWATYVEPVTITLEIEFKDNAVTYSELNIGEFNPFIVVDQNRAKEVHLPNYKPTDLAGEWDFGTFDDDSDPDIDRYYKSNDNLLWAINIPATFKYPKEKQDIVWSYNYFAEWAQSDGADYPDWYMDKPGYRNAWTLY